MGCLRQIYGSQECLRACDPLERMYKRATLAAILIAHECITRLRCIGWIAGLLDHRPGLLIVRGVVLADSLRRSGRTNDDLYALLRAQGVRALSDVRYAILETRGRISIVREEGGTKNGTRGAALSPLPACR